VTASAAVIAIRPLLWYGIRIRRRDDGSLALTPSELVTPDVLELARAVKPEIEALLAELPAPGRCPICGDPTGWPDSTTAHCTQCALIRAIQWREANPESPDISTKASAA